METDCPDEAKLFALAANRLNEAGAGAVRKHLAMCARCARRLERIEEEVSSDTLQRATADTQPPKGPATGPVEEERTLIPAPPSGEPSSDPPLLVQGQRLGRYLIVERLAAGGMGEVYAAYDPQLDRKVALKVVHADAMQAMGATEGRNRLLREAQALARLSHPNVVAVHDVGTVGDELFIAMEFVEGVSLRQWLKAKPRSLREVLDVFIRAGRGLAAAHAAGLVHRDFKPHNVQIGRDGSVRVLDFGLARPVSAPTPRASAPAPPSPRAGESPAPRTLTQMGTVMGTVGYMSPEQLRGDPTDARTDQYSFCVALYEALCGERPFRGVEFKEYAAEVEAGAAPVAAAAPAWIQAIVARGLIYVPDARFPSMDALLAALEDDPLVRRRRRLRAAGAGAAVLLLVIASASALRSSAPCQGAGLRWAGTWDAPRKVVIHRAFAQTGKPFAEAAWGNVERALDNYTRAWTLMRTDACEATRVRGEQSAELLDLRMGCLDQRRGEVAALTALFAHADEDVVTHSAKALQGLSALSPCADGPALLGGARPPLEPAARERAAALQARLAEVKALLGAGKVARGLELAGPAAEAAAELKSPSLQAEALVQLAELLILSGRFQDGERSAHRAALAAQQAGDLERRARAWILLLRVTGLNLERFEEGHLWAEYARAVIERMGRPPELEGRLWETLGRMAINEGRYPEGLEDAQAALRLALTASGPDSVQAADARWTVGMLLSWMDRHAEALTHLRSALEVEERALGPDHPSLGKLRGDIATILEEVGHHEEARAEQERSLGILEGAYGPDHPAVATTLTNLGALYTGLGRYADAERSLRRAVAIREVKFGVDHPKCASPLYNLGQNALRQGQGERALEVLERGLALLEKPGDRDSQVIGEFLIAISQARLLLRRPGPAAAAAERALAILEKAPQDSLPLAEARFALARALWENNAGAARARREAEAARALFIEAGASGQEQRAKVEAWLSGKEGRRSR